MEIKINQGIVELQVQGNKNIQAEGIKKSLFLYSF